MRPPRSLLASVVAAVALGAVSTATAQFTNSATAGPMSLASATLAAPTAPTAAQTNCKNAKPPTNTVGWTATSSAFATGYRIERATTSGGPYSLVLPRRGSGARLLDDLLLPRGVHIPVLDDRFGADRPDDAQQQVRLVRA